MNTWYVIVISQDKHDSLLLHKSKLKPRMSVNSKDIIQMHLGYN